MNWLRSSLAAPHPSGSVDGAERRLAVKFTPATPPVTFNTATGARSPLTEPLSAPSTSLSTSLSSGRVESSSTPLPAKRYGGGLLRLSDLQRQGMALPTSATAPRATPVPSSGREDAERLPDSTSRRLATTSRAGSGKRSAARRHGRGREPLTVELGPDGRVLEHHWDTAKRRRVFVYNGRSYKGSQAHKMWEEVKRLSHLPTVSPASSRPTAAKKAARPSTKPPKSSNWISSVPCLRELLAAPTIGSTASPTEKNYTASSRSLKAARALPGRADTLLKEYPLPSASLHEKRVAQQPTEVIDITDSDFSSEGPEEDMEDVPLTRYFVSAPPHDGTEEVVPALRGVTPPFQLLPLAALESSATSSAVRGITVLGVPQDVAAERVARRGADSLLEKVHVVAANAYADCQSLDALDGMDLEGMLDTSDEIGGVCFR